MIFKERQVLWVVGALVFAAAFALVFSVMRPERPASRAPGPPAEVVLGANAEAVVHYLREDGLIASTEVLSLPDGLVGLTLSELQKARPEWRVVSFGSERVVVNVPCEPVTGDAGFIGVEGGKVAIFRGSPDGCHEMSHLTEIDVESLGGGLDPSTGGVIPFDDPAEVPFILEGLTGHTL